MISSIRGLFGRMPAVSSATLAFVVGNEAGDLDSIVSCIAYSHILSLSPHNHWKFVPLVQFKRNEFRFRKDAVWLFGLCGVELDQVDAPNGPFLPQCSFGLIF